MNNYPEKICVELVNLDRVWIMNTEFRQNLKVFKVYFESSYDVFF